MADRKIDKPSDTEFAKAIVQNVPDVDPSMLNSQGETYYTATVFKRVIKKK